MAKASSAVAALAYTFFSGAMPGRAGMDFLVSPNANNINSSNDQSFNLETATSTSRSTSASFGEGIRQFAAEYGGFSLAAATKKACGEIGAEPSDAKVSAMLDAPLA